MTTTLPNTNTSNPLRTTSDHLAYTSEIEALLTFEESPELDEINDVNDRHGRTEWTQERLDSFLADRAEWRGERD